MKLENDPYAIKQIAAYENRNQIKVGDTFLWKKRKKGYISSGTLDCEYMHIIDGGRYDIESEAVLTVCNVYEGQNGWGNFVDYWLTSDRILTGEYKPKDCIIINGPDAFKMQRWMEGKTVYVDKRGWKFNVMPGLGVAYKARYKKPGKTGWHCVAALPWRDTVEEAEKDLAAWAEKKKMDIVDND